MSKDQIHASCISLDGRGVVLQGPSGSGKSDLALRLIDQGAILVADDRVDIKAVDGDVYASPPANIAGQFEVRGLGIVRLAFLEETTVGLVVDLVARENMPRLPDSMTKEFFGMHIRHLTLHAFDSSTPAKIRLALGVSKDAMVAPSWPKK